MMRFSLQQRITNSVFTFSRRQIALALSLIRRAEVEPRGIALYLAVATMSGALAIALFMSLVFIKELRISQDVTNSIKAAYVADTIMEYALYQVRQTSSPVNLNITDCSDQDIITSLSSTAKCVVTSDQNVFINSDTLCTSANYPTATGCTEIFASGAYSGINRKIEIVYPNL